MQVERGEESLIFTFLVKNEEGHKQSSLKHQFFVKNEEAYRQ